LNISEGGKRHSVQSHLKLQAIFVVCRLPSLKFSLIQRITSMSPHEIESLDFLEVKALRDACNVRMKEMRETGTEQLRLKFIDDAAALGLSPEDVFGVAKKQRRKRRKAKDDAADDAVLA